MPNNKQTIAFLALPLIAFALLIVYSAIGTMGPHFSLPVEGYDPRNLLYGHYMNIRINASILNELHQCACIDGENNISYMSCEEAKTKSCVAVLNILKDKLLQSLTKPVQIYVDETTAPILEAAIRQDPKRLTADTTLSSDGAIVVHGLLLDGQPVKQMPSNPFDKLVK